MVGKNVSVGVIPSLWARNGKIDQAKELVLNH